MSDPRPPKSPRKGKYVNIRITFLNDTVHVFQVPVKGVGSLLWDAVVNHLQLLEADYFDLEYTNQHGDDCWLDKDKTVLKQIGSPDIPLRFCVKFYTPDPGLLEDELTRYLFALQVRKDLLRGELRCSENTAALLASYIVQGEIGDFDIDECPDPTYLAVFKFVPEHLQTHDFMAKVMDYHRQHIGESPSEADLNLLDTARKVELYGIKMQPAKDHEGVSLNLAVAHLGVLVFQQYTKINTFSWAKVRKLSFKRKKFLIKLHADTYDRRLEGVAHTPTKSGRGYYKDTVEFFFDTRDRCKLFWKRCIEHHAFFRCQVVAKVPRNKTRVVSRGSSFRYCGRTQKQLVEFVRENIGKRPHFERSTSGRISSRSTSVTPKISSKPGMHSSSADLHTSSGSRSSGSHILDSNHTPGSGILRDHSGTPHSAMRVESVDVHSDSSMSGSRSLNSPRLEHGLSIDQDVIEAVNARTEGAMTDDDEDEDNIKNSPRNTQGMSHVSSETKGAHSILSPELNSPVRYVGLYSEVGSPDYHGDGLTSPEVDINVKEKALSNECTNLAGDGHHIAAEADHTAAATAVGDGDLKTNSDPSSGGGSQNNQVSRPNLDLKLTNITLSSPSNVSSVDEHPALSQQTPSDLPATSSPQHKPSSQAHTSTPPPLSSHSLTTSMSASQNDEISDKPLKSVKPAPNDQLANSPHYVPTDVNLDLPAHDHKKVSCVVVGQHQQPKVTDLSPPFPSPPPPLSPQYMDEDVKKSLEETSPSCCVTDTAQIWQDKKVRLSSRVPSLDSSRVADKPVPRAAPAAAPESRAKTPVLETSIDAVVPEVEESKLEEPESSKEGSSKPKDMAQKPEMKKCPNGGLVGAGAPVKDHLESEPCPSRKLSAGTDLIEDIPYILHRRLDGQKEETAVFRVSEADKLKRQRSLSPATKAAPLSCPPKSERPGGETSKHPEKRCLSPDAETSKSRHHSDKSPPLSRRYEFVNVHKLPSRTSYSSVDDTTSPSAEQELLSHHDHITADGAKSSPEKKPKGTEAKSSSPSRQAQALEPSSSAAKDDASGATEGTPAAPEQEESKSSLSTQLEPEDITKATPQGMLDEGAKTVPSGEVVVKKTVKNDPAVASEDVQFYSPKIPGSQRLKKVIKTSTSDDSPEAVAEGKTFPTVGEHESASSESKKKASDLSLNLQFFEVSKPQPHHGRDTTDKPATDNIPNQPPPQDTPACGSAGIEKRSEVKPVQQRAPSLSATGRNSTSSTSSSDNNQFMIDLPSPAAALFYSDNDSPPPTQTRANGGSSPLTFSTFRPDPAEETLLKVEDLSKDKSRNNNRWSLQSVEEAEEVSEYKVIMSEGVVEKSALKKRTLDESDKKEPKRVSWHEDGDLQHSYHSDVSMTAQRSPVDEGDTTLFGEATTAMDSGDILETLESLRQDNSESDMTNSGSSVSTSDGSDEETQSNAKQVYLQYAASKGLSSKDGTIDSGVGGMSEGGPTFGREISPLDSLERIVSLEDSFGSRKFAVEEDVKSTKDGSPLEPLEKLSSLRVDNFDEEGEADDEDDEPNFPPPPPILDIPDEMLISYEGDLPLPDLALEGATAAQQEFLASYQHKLSKKKGSIDPHIGDPAGDMSYTTSESESDFDIETANQQLHRFSTDNAGRDSTGRIAGEAKKSLCDPSRKSASSQLGTKKPQDLPPVLPKPVVQHQAALGQPTSGQPPVHFVQKSQPLPPHKPGPPVLPKPKPPPTQPRPIRQPQMGKGKHFERTRHKSSSSSSSSSSEQRSHPPPPAPS